MPEFPNPYDVVIADLEAKRAQIDTAIETMKALKVRMSPALSGGTVSYMAPANGSQHPQPFDMDKIPSDAFFNLTIGEASIKFLKMVNRKPQGTKTIMEAFERGGLKGKNYPTVYGVLSRRQKQEKDVVNVHGDWGLASWYGKNNPGADITDESEK